MAGSRSTPGIRPHPRRASARGAAAAALVAAGALLAGLSGCDAATATGKPGEEGRLLVDGYVSIDRFAFSRAACDEVLPESFASLDSVPADAAASLEVVSIACYAVDVRVEDSLGRAVRGFQAYFDIPGRADGDKERGATGHIAWDGRDEAGDPVPAGDYLWRLDFRFGAGRSVKYRAVMRLR